MHNNGFEFLSLNQLCDLMNGYAFKPDDWSTYGTPIIRIQNLNGSKEYNYFEKWVPDRYYVEAGDLLFSWSGNRGTSFGPYIWAGPKGLLNQHIFKVAPKNSVNKKWLFYALHIAQEKAEKQAHGGSGLVHVKREELLSYRIPTPSEKEQRRIAEILDTIDEAIQKTEALIDKLKAMKQGLMHDLLVRGLDDDGKLRDPKAQPEQFKNSESNAIPVSWQLMSLENACELIKDGTHLPPKRVNDGPLLLSVQNMDGGKLVFQENDTRVPWSFYKRMHQSWKIAGNDVLLAIVGATIGKVAMVPQKMNRFTLQRSVAVLRGKRNVLENKFLFLYFCSEPFKIKLWQRVNQTAQPGIYLDEIAEILVPIPPFKEQLDICNVCSAVDIRIQNEQRYLRKLKLQKKGLMHDLLTGKVRVKADSAREKTLS